MLEHNTNKKDYSERIMMQLDDMIAAHLHEGRLPDFYAKQMQTEQYRLEKCVKEHHGMNLSKYLVAKRNTEAYRLLLETDLQVKQIAFAVGFAAGSCFCSAFRQLEGMGPRAYRKINGVDVKQLHDAALMARLDDLILKNMDKWSSSIDYARVLSVSRRTLDACVQHVRGTSMGRYLHQKRKEEATRLLKETELAVQKISNQVGFATSSTLSKAFRTAGSKRPREVRAVFKSENLNKFTYGEIGNV